MKDFIIKQIQKRIEDTSNIKDLLNGLTRQNTTNLDELIAKLEAAIQWVKDSPDDDNNILSDDLANLNDSKLTQYPKNDG